MARGGGKRFAVLTAAAAVVALAAAAFALRGSILEAWWIYRLSSSDVAVRRAAGESLAALPSVRAIPRLLEIVEVEEKPEEFESMEGQIDISPWSLQCLRSHPLFGPLERCLSASGKRAAPALQGYLVRGKGAVVIFAARALLQIDPRNSEAIALLRRALLGEALDLRYWAFSSLEEAGIEPVEELAEVLRGAGEVDIRVWAARTLADIGPIADLAIPSLGAALNDKASCVRLASARALLEMGVARNEVLPVILAEIAGGSADPEAARALAVIDPSEATWRLVAVLARRAVPLETIDSVLDRAPAALPLVLELSKDGKPDVRCAALAILPGFGAAAKGAVGALISALEDDDLDVAAEAARALQGLGAAVAARAVGPLVALLGRAEREMSSDLASGALDALLGMGPAAAPAVPVVLRILEDGDPSLQWMAAGVLCAIGPATPEAVRVLRALRHPDPSGREGKIAGVWATAALATVDAESRAKLLLSFDGEGDVLWAAAVAAGVLRMKEALPALISLVFSTSLESEESTYLWAIARIGLDDLAPVTAELRGAEAERRRHALGILSCLNSLHPASASCVPDVLPLLADPDEKVVARTAAALGVMGLEARVAVPALEKLLRDRRPDVRHAARDALARLATR